MAFNRDRNSRPGGGFRPRPSFGGRPSFGDKFSRGPVEMHQAVCDNCGRDCQVPFRPTSGKPVFCSNCFEGKSRENTSGFGSRSNDRPANFTGEKGIGQFEALNKKLDKIIELLTPKTPVEVIEEKEVKLDPIESGLAKKKSTKKIK